MPNSNSARVTLDRYRVSAAWSFSQALTAASGSGFIASETTLVSRTIIQSKVKGLAGALSRALEDGEIFVGQIDLAVNGGQGIAHTHAARRLDRVRQYLAHLRLRAAAVLRPCLAAAHARCMSSGTFPSVRIAIIQNP